MRGEINEVRELEDEKESFKERLVTRVNGGWINEVRKDKTEIRLFDLVIKKPDV